MNYCNNNNIPFLSLNCYDSDIIKQLKENDITHLQGKRNFPKEKGYVYFQDFISGNKEDLRIAIVDDYIWGFKRKVRQNDFRASGSGMLNYDLSDVPLTLIKSLHDLSKKLKTQSIAFDLVKNKDNYLIVEISYGYVGELLYNSPGYWNENLVFINEKLNPEDIILINFIKC